jgi:hypothetical protein
MSVAFLYKYALAQSKFHSKIEGRVRLRAGLALLNFLTS